MHVLIGNFSQNPKLCGAGPLYFSETGPEHDAGNKLPQTWLNGDRVFGRFLGLQSEELKTKGVFSGYEITAVLEALDLHSTTIHFTGVTSLNAIVTVFPAPRLHDRKVIAN